MTQRRSVGAAAPATTVTPLAQWVWTNRFPHSVAECQQCQTLSEPQRGVDVASKEGGVALGT